MQKLLCATLVLGLVGSCILVHDFDVEPALMSMGGAGGSGEAGEGGDGGNGATGAGGEGAAPCEASDPILLIAHSDENIKHLDIEPVPTGRVYYTLGSIDGGGDGPLHEIRRINKDGSDDELFLGSDSGDDDYDYIKLSDARVYYTTFGRDVRSVLMTGNSPIPISAMLRVYTGLALGDRSNEVAYYHEYEPVGSPLWAGPGQAEEPFTDAVVDNGYGLVVDPTDESEIYWTSYGGSDDTGTIVYRPSFGTVHVLETGQNKPSGIALDVDYVYWIDAFGTIYRHERSDPGGASDEVFHGSSPDSGVGGPVVVDDTYVYWGVVGGLYRAPKDGSGAPDRLLTATRVSDLAMDDDAIYAVTFEDGNLFKVCK